MKRKIKIEYDEDLNETTVRIGRKGLRFEGKPTPVKLIDAEHLLRSAPERS